MAEERESRIHGAIERVGLSPWRDPEAVQELQRRQQMHERVADECRRRRGIRFQDVLRQAEEAPVEPAPAPDAAD